jgi:hypothetical protein
MVLMFFIPTNFEVHLKPNGRFKEMRCNLTGHKPDVSYSAVSCSPYATLRTLMIDDTGVYEILPFPFLRDKVNHQVHI